MLILTSLYLIMNTKKNNYNQIFLFIRVIFLISPRTLNSALSRRKILEDLMLDKKKSAQVIDKLNLTTVDSLG